MKRLIIAFIYLFFAVSYLFYLVFTVLIKPFELLVSEYSRKRFLIKLRRVRIHIRS